MRYFLMKEDKRYTNLPQVTNWYQTIEAKELSQGKYETVPNRMLLKVKGDAETNDLDVLLHPFFVVSKPIKKVLELYEPHYVYKELIYLQQKTKQVTEYFLPILPEIDCLTKESEYNLDRSQVTKAVLDSEAVGDCSIFTLKGVRNRHIVVRLDLVESMLRRRAKGFLLEEVTVMRRANHGR